MESQQSSSRVDLMTMERNQGNYMKSLYFNLISLIPNQNSKEAFSLPEQLEKAAKYIEVLENRVEKLKEKKKNLMMGFEKLATNTNVADMVVGLEPPQIEIHEVGSALEVVLITGLDSYFMFNEVIRVLHEEGVEVMKASFSVIDGKVFHTVHSQVGDPTCGFEVVRIAEKLKKFCP